MFFFLSKTLQFFADPGNAFLIALLLGFVLCGTRLKVLGRVLIVLTVLSGIFLTIVPIGYWMSASLEKRFPVPAKLPDRVDGIIVLGGVIDPTVTKAVGEPAINGAVERITESAKLARRFPHVKVIYSGGSGSLLDTEAREADYVAELYGELGVPGERLVLDRDARNTVENAKNVFALAKPKPGENWLLVTSAVHMARAVGVFRQIGWETIPYPVDFHFAPGVEIRSPMSFTVGLATFNHALHEWLGMTAYWLAGHTDSAFPKPRTESGS